MTHHPVTEPRPAHHSIEQPVVAFPDLDLGTIPEAAAYARCSQETIRNMIAAGALPAYRIGGKLVRVDMAAVRSMPRRITPTSA
jgi:excisionase family DNA binding protein